MKLFPVLVPKPSEEIAAGQIFVVERDDELRLAMRVACPKAPDWAGIILEPNLDSVVRANEQMLWIDPQPVLVWDIRSSNPEHTRPIGSIGIFPDGVAILVEDHDSAAWVSLDGTRVIEFRRARPIATLHEWRLELPGSPPICLYSHLPTPERG